MKILDSPTDDSKVLTLEVIHIARLRPGFNAKEEYTKMVYRLECCGYKSIYFGQTVRHLTTRIEEHRKEDTPVGQHIRQCGSESGKLESNGR